MREGEIIKQLIQSYINGRLSVEEEQHLCEWLSASDENKRNFSEAVRTMKPASTGQVRLNRALAETKSQLFTKDNTPKVPGSRTRTINFRRWIELAAVLVLGLFIKIGFDYFTTKSHVAESLCIIEAPIGQKSKVELPDGSLVWLNSESKIQFHNNFNTNRQVKLTGEAYFEVEKNEKHAFEVEIEDYKVVVHGTRFNVMAYHDLGYVQTTLVEGSVEIKRGEQQLFLKPGEQLNLKNGKFTKKSLNTSVVTAWKENKFYFDSVEFSELVRRLERWYDVDIEVKNPELLENKFSGVFKNDETIFQVLDALQHYIDFEYSHESFRKIIIK